MRSLAAEGFASSSVVSVSKLVEVNRIEKSLTIPP